MATDQVPSHDIMAAGPSTDPVLPPSPNRTSSMFSSSSGRTQISISIQTMANFTCPQCQAHQYSLQMLRFSRRNSFLSPVLCPRCKYELILFGGSRSSPGTRRPTTQTEHGSEDAEPSMPRGRPYNAASNKFKPNVSSGLASGAHIARSIAAPNHGPETIPSEENGLESVQEIDFERSATAHVGNAAELEPRTARHDCHSPSVTTKSPRRLRRHRVPQALRSLYHHIQEFLGYRVQPLFVSLDTPASQPGDTAPRSMGNGERPVHDALADGPTEDVIPPASAIRFTSPQPPSVASTLDHRCDCTGRCHCSEVRFPSEQILDAPPVSVFDRIFHTSGARGSERSLASLQQRPESTSSSHFFFDFRDRFNHSSRESNSIVRYPSRLSFGGATNRDRSISRARERNTAIVPAPPQLPHPSATQVQGGAIHLPGSVHDSAINMSTARDSQSFTDVGMNVNGA